MKKAQKTPNTEIIRADKKRYDVITNYHLNDKRLTLAQKGFLTMLYTLPTSWKITQRATSDFLNISVKTFNVYIKQLIKLGYIELIKTKNNKATYKLHERAIKGDFDARNIDAYTIKQLNNYLNDNRTEERYKNLIRKALEKAKETSEHFNKMLDDIDKQESELNEQAEPLPFE